MGSAVARGHPVQRTRLDRVGPRGGRPRRGRVPDAQMTPDDVKWDAQGLAPAIVQDAASGEVLALAWMNRESLRRTLETRLATFWSRSRGELWVKGSTSGNTQAVRAVALDCDQDAILVRVDPAGPACHTGARSCFLAGDPPLEP